MAEQGQPIEVLYVEIAAKADQLVADAQEAVNTVVKQMKRVDQATQETESMYKRLGRTIKQALTVATGIQFANMSTQLINKVVGFGKALISTNAQLQMFTKSFEVLTGSAEEAGEIIEWVKEQAKLTPFDVPGLIQASQMLMTWGLDLKEWFTVVGDVAAGMNRPITQVVNAVGTLATGQTGEAVRRFRDLGINLREFMELEFDARGAMITPLEEAIPIVRQIMIDKFGGMMESQSKTWGGVMENMSDTWQQFVQVVGEPVFTTLNEALLDLQTWVGENEEGIEQFAKNLGAALGAALDLMVALLTKIGEFLGKVDEAVVTARKMGALAAAPVAMTAGAIKAAREGDIARATEYGVEYMNAIAGVGEAEEEAAEATEDFTEKITDLTAAQEAGIRAVQKLGGAYSELSEEAVVAIVSVEGITNPMLEAARAFLDNEEAMSRLPPWLQAVAADNRELIDTTLEVAKVYHEAAESFTETEAALAALRAEQEANLALAQEVAAKLGDRLRSVMEAYEKTVKKLVQDTAEAIAEIEANAAQAEAAAIKKSQEAIAQARANFAREQIQRRRQFNLEWARLLREQNQEVLDAEWEYQFAKENLLIEGDEIALAELEARYKHEKDLRGREQGDARTDMQQQLDEANRQRDEQFQLQIKALEERLTVELENIRTKAAEEVQAKKDALEERLAHEDEALQERLEKLGERLAQEVGDNQAAANLVIEAWRLAYGDQVAQAAAAGILIRQELDAIIAAAVNAAAAMRGITLGAGVTTGGRRRPGGGYSRQHGGYSPENVAPVTMHPGEFVLTAGTTAALEEAAGGGLTQHTVRQLTESRRTVDMNLTGYGVPADVIGRLEREIVDALKREATEF